MSGLLKPFLAGPARHAVRLARDPGYRTLAWLEATLGRRPRYTPVHVRAGGWSIDAPDAASLLSAWREIVVDDRYAFPWSGSAAPRILDLGANVGLSVLQFKRRHPGADIVAVEADPNVFGYLERNLAANGVTGVERLQRASWTGPGRVAFQPEGADAGRVVVADARTTVAGDARTTVAATGGDGLIDVETLDVPALLESRAFDVVKMDIEGAELDVLPACGPALARVHCVAVEIHTSPDRPQRLAAVFRALEDAGFRIHVHGTAGGALPAPGDATAGGFDVQLNVLGWKP